MPTDAERITTLEKQVASFISSTQIEALISAKGADVMLLTNAVTAMNAKLDQILDALQAVRNQIADHETRIVALEP